MLLSILIVNWNTGKLLAQCLTSIFEHPPQCNFEIIVVDNASTDLSLESVGTAFTQVHIIENQTNIGFGGANNQAAEIAQGKYLLLLNPDTVIYSDAIQSLVDYLESNPSVGAVGPKLVNADGTLQVSIQPAPNLFREAWRLFHLDLLHPISQYSDSYLKSTKPVNVDILMGACILTRKAIIDQHGFFDEQFFVYSEEVDLCVSILRAGWKIHWLPTAVVLHYGGQSTQQVADEMFLELYRNKVKFFRKHYGKTQVYIYKLILAAAALVRYIPGRIARWIPMFQNRQVEIKAAQYRNLLSILPGL